MLTLEAKPANFTDTLRADSNQAYQIQASEDVTAGWVVLANITTDTRATPTGRTRA